MKKYCMTVGFIMLSVFNLLAQNVSFSKVCDINSNIKIVEKGKVKVHTYVNQALVQVSNHIIELKDSLVIIDAQLTYTFSKEVLKYALTLNKPIARIIITHSHPDHILGLYAYNKYPVYALKETINTLQKDGEKDAAPEILVPGNELVVGIMMIDNVKLGVKKVLENEDDVSATIEIPSVNFFFPGDLLYNKVHLFPGFNHLNDWKLKLEDLKINLKNKTIFPGHGYAANSSIITNNIAYLEKAINIASQPSMDEAKYKAEMIKAYPNYGASILIDFGGAALFQNK